MLTSLRRVSRLRPLRRLLGDVEEVHRPRVADGVRPIGPMAESAFATQPWLVDRGGRFVQVDQVMYRVVELADGTRSIDEIAAQLSSSTGIACSVDYVRQLIEQRLVPVGLIAPDPRLGPRTTSTARSTPSALALRMRMAIVPPAVIDAVTLVLQYLYAPPLLVLLLFLIAQAQWWLFAVHGVAAAFQDAGDHPSHVPIVFGLLVASAAFHEFGHAAALRFGGGRVRGMGVGLYLVYPAFYTDVTDNYRLRRWPRVRTDLGGFYFNLLFLLGLMAAYHVTAHEFLLLAALLIDFEILHQCLPFARLDGYWALADLTGVPDFLSYMGPYLRSIVPIRCWQGRRLPKLKWWASLVFGLYLAIAVPAIVVFVVLAIKNAPHVTLAAWSVLQRHLAELSQALATGDGFAAAGAEAELVWLLLPALGLLLMLVTLTQRLAVALWHFSRPSWPRRVVASLLAVSMAAVVALLWAPSFSSQAAPLATPTALPTDAPTTATVEPTATASPTVVPTSSPTTAPTALPTRAPTADPTEPAPTAPTAPVATHTPAAPAAPELPAATVVPARAAKPQPPRSSPAPTLEPTSEPTVAPTMQPTAAVPTRKPTASARPIASPRPRTTP